LRGFSTPDAVRRERERLISETARLGEIHSRTAAILDDLGYADRAAAHREAAQWNRELATTLAREFGRR
jgi:hypothetical protein